MLSQSMTGLNGESKGAVQASQAEHWEAAGSTQQLAGKAAARGGQQAPDACPTLAGCGLGSAAP
jgi:hypothetical protein